MSTTPVDPITWRASLVSVTDGDTVRLTLARDGRVDHVFSQRLTAPSVAIRLVTLDTPEHGQEGWGQAKQDVADWFAQQTQPLMCDTYGSGGMDRLLGDVYPNGRRGETLSQWMLQRGWLPWVRGK